MGQSADFSESIKIIQEAHADAVAILEKWRDMLEAQGEIVFSIRNSDGSTAEITLPTIREAINRYLGGVFDQITLTDGNTTVIVRLDADGNVELVNADGFPANLIVGHIAASSITGANGQLYIRGSVNLANAVISNGQVTSLSVYSAQINGAVFRGSALITGGTRITGNATIRNATIQNLDAGTVRYRKQVLQWGMESYVDSTLEGPVSGGLWTGDVSVLERAGIKSEPTWSDCIYIPEPFNPSSNRVNIYWGTPDEGETLVTDVMGGGTDFSTMIMAMWPYKMYEAVNGGYRIRWLPLNDLGHRIIYVRSGDMSVQAGDPSPVIPIKITDTSTATDRTATLITRRAVASYECRRFIADTETTTAPDSEVTTNYLFAT